MTIQQFIEALLALFAWLGVVALLFVIGAGVVWVWDGLVEIGTRFIERPRNRHLGVPRRLAQELEEMNHLTDEQLDYELSTSMPGYRITGVDPGRGDRTVRLKRPSAPAESRVIPLYEARVRGGIPIWQLRRLFNLHSRDLGTRVDVERWLRVADSVRERLDKVMRVLNIRREAFLLTEKPETPIPAFLRCETNKTDDPLPPVA